MSALHKLPTLEQKLYKGLRDLRQAIKDDGWIDPQPQMVRACERADKVLQEAAHHARALAGQPKKRRGS